MDVNRALGATFRAVHDTERDGQPVRSVEGARVYATDREDLWDAVTDPERLPRWFLPVTGDLRLGGRYRLEGNAEGTITRCDPPEVLELTWEFASNVSWVSVTLARAPDGGTRLTLVHTMAKDPASEAHWATYGPGATGVGWDLSFFGLGVHLDTGEAVDPKASEAWMGSEPGKAFLLTCAAAWGDAHVAAGEDGAVARPMAEKTGAFYTGG